MNIYLIYKQTTDSTGNVSQIDLVECDMNVNLAVKFTKFYNLQIPSDLKNRIQYGYIETRLY